MRNLQASDLFTDSELRMFVTRFAGYPTYAEFGEEVPLTSPLRSGGCELGNSRPRLDPPLGEPEEESDGPDPYDMQVETEMELEARDGSERE